MQNASKGVTPIVSGQESGKSEDNRLDYTTPTLAEYGDIASLVKAIITTGPDGGPPPFEAIS